jgi:ankyrin repeat protein
MHAAEDGKPAAVDYLLSLGADPSQRDPRGKAAADHASAYGPRHWQQCFGLVRSNNPCWEMA